MSKSKVKQFPVMMSLCFWCGKEKNEILIGKRAVAVDKIKEKVIHNYDPCETCRENMGQGITCIEMDHVPWTEGQPSLAGQYPSGRWMVITENGAREMIQEGELLESVLKSKKVFVPTGIFKDMFQSK